MFFLLAFAMIVSWRIAMYRSFTKLQKEMEKEDGFIMKRYEANLKTVYVNKRQRQRRCLFIENNMKLLCE